MSSLLHIQEPDAKSSHRKASMQDFLELGFRPFYLCGSIWALLGAGIWVFAPQLLQASLTGVFWHAHEMLWGFVAAIAVGFLLTATTNWTGINPLHGRPLGCLALIWLIARIGFLVPGTWAFGVASAADLLFFAGSALAIARSLWISKSRHNFALPLLLIGMGVADGSFLYATWIQLDYSTLMHQLFTGLLCMLVITLLLARRVMPFFASRAIPGLELNRHTRSGQLQASLAALATLSWYLKFDTAAALLFCAVGTITLWHLIAWKPWRVLRTPLLWILYAGYLGLGAGCMVTAAYAMGWTAQLSWPVHTIAMAGFSTLIIGMMTRTALGHTGRMLQTDRYMVCAFTLLLLAVLLRAIALSGYTSSTAWLHASTACWVLAFGTYLLRFIPILTQPRADKRPGKPINLNRS